MASVFISHAHQDANFAKQLSVDLREQGYVSQTVDDVASPESLLSSSQLDGRIVKAISQNDYFIPVLTPESIRSPWVSREIQTAIMHESEIGNVMILPVLESACTLPDALGLRAPADFTESYSAGLRSLLDKMSSPGAGLRVAISESNGIKEASEDTARKLNDALAPLHHQIQNLNPLAFENLVADTFISLGFLVELRQHSEDGGIDLVALGGRDRGHRPVLIQCKRYIPGRRLAVEAISSVRAAVRHNIDKAVLVITSSFTVPASTAVKGDTRHFSRSRWELDPDDWSTFFHWMAETPGMSKNIAESVVEARSRYSDLVDKKFRGSLSIEEESERKDLEDLLDTAEAPFYEPFKQKLIAARDRLPK
jgi:hypothetical protein